VKITTGVHGGYAYAVKFTNKITMDLLTGV
jgi:hypothetical protein